MRLVNRVAVITGGSSGIGKSLAPILAKEGATVVIVARTRTRVDSAVDSVNKAGGMATGLNADVSRCEDVKGMVKKILERFGNIDILVNSAGVCTRKTLLETTETEWDRTIGTNLKGIFLCCREVLSVMVRQKSGVIINVSSGAGRYGSPELSAYCASKFGVIGLTESLSKEVPEGIRVYAVCPGGVDTEMHRRVFPEDDSSALDKAEDVAGKMAKLCMPSCKTKNGSVVELY